MPSPPPAPNNSLGASGRAVHPAAVPSTPLGLFNERPLKISAPAPGVLLFDFGRVAFGNAALVLPGHAPGGLRVHFGEDLVAGRINRQPPGSVRYACVPVPAGPAPGETRVVAPPPDARNTGGQAVPTPSSWGVVLPFRWIELEGWPAEETPPGLYRRAAFSATWDDQAAAFASSDAMLNQIWELCRYSIKATTFAGLYVDGDRERIPYEADAYLNQLSHLACDSDFRMARDTFDHLMRFPTWPTEWAPHLVFMVHADWMHTGDTGWLAPRYESLKSKLLLERARAADGLVAGTPEQRKLDIVDWPPAERDGYVFTEVNTVVNAFHLRGLQLMGSLARALGKNEEAAAFDARFRETGAAFQRRLFDPSRGLFRDGEGTEHASLHANLFPLAFGLTPDAHRAGIVSFLTAKGMACSVYPAQYLLEALFEQGADDTALALIAADGDRSWKHMIESGATLTWEAWDQSYKPNQDWNHAWGAAPANLLPRFVAGVQPLSPGWTRARIRPHAGPLVSCESRIPTPRGPVELSWRRDRVFTLSFLLPPGMTASLDLPAGSRTTPVVRVDGREVAATVSGNRVRVGGTWNGRHVVEVA